MFIPHYPLLGPDDDVGSAPDLGLGDDHEDPAGHPDAAPDPVNDDGASSQPSPPPPPETAEEAVIKALGVKEEPPSTAPPSEPTPPADSKPAIDEMYQIPRGLNGEARAKFKALSDHAREVDQQYQQQTQTHAQVQQKLDGFENILRDAGATAETMNAHLQYIKACSSGDLEGALAFIDAERQAIARALGRPVDGVDVLGDFPDLRSKVDGLSLSEEDANEIARMRRQAGRNEHDQQQRAAQQQQQQHYAAHEARVTDARSAVSQWVEEQSKSLDWAVLEPAIVSYITNAQQTLRELDPSGWLPAIKAHYASLASMASRPQGVPRSSEPRPLRPQGAGGVPNTLPATAEEAVMLRLKMRK